MDFKTFHEKCRSLQLDAIELLPSCWVVKDPAVASRGHQAVQIAVFNPRTNHLAIETKGRTRERFWQTTKLSQLHTFVYQ